MQSLVDMQVDFARAVTTGECGGVAASLVGGADAGTRLEIHLRHYEASLTAALRDKFPACVWLAGSSLVDAAARAYVRAHPPRQPCIAEYGSDFPRFLASHGRVAALPYLESFADLEWAVGQVSIAIDHPPLSWQDLARAGERLLDSTLALQPGLRYVRSAWHIDTMMTTYLSGTAPEQFVLAEADTFIEVRGARGTVQVARLDAAAFLFRSKLAAGRSISDAAGCALDCDSTFDPGVALRRLAQAGLVTGTSAGGGGATS